MIKKSRFIILVSILLLSTTLHARNLRVTFRMMDDQLQVTQAKDVQDNTSLFRDDKISPFVTQVVSKDKKILFSGGFENPLLVRYEREDPERESVWEHQEFLLKETVFELKIPISPEADHILIYKRNSKGALQELLQWKIENVQP